LISHTSIETIAGAVGFKNADSFRRAFGRRHGVSPNGYRKNVKHRRRPDTRASVLVAA
jgi:transcriptional regulator GlxA family with amidase domain